MSNNSRPDDARNSHKRNLPISDEVRVAIEQARDHFGPSGPLFAERHGPLSQETWDRVTAAARHSNVRSFHTIRHTSNDSRQPFLLACETTISDELRERLLDDLIAGASSHEQAESMAESREDMRALFPRPTDSSGPNGSSLR